jgi:predicted phage baseplate assembly protein
MRWGDLVVAGDARRRRMLARHHDGIDGVEVHGRRLTVYFMERVPEGITHHNVRVEGLPDSLAARAVAVHRHEPADAQLEDRLVVELDRTGSAGPYVLRLVERAADGRPGWAPLRGLDLRYAQASFRFDVDAPRPPIRTRRPGAAASTDDDVSYLGRDYEGLRRLMFDRLAVTLPGWTEQHVPDVFVTVIELLAYTGDDLSYYEDAVATEAYLQTARQRISVRRHARLVDYRLHEGCHARTWVCVSVDTPVKLALGDLRFAAAGALVAPGAPLVPTGTDLSTVQQYTPLPISLGPPAAGPSTVELRPAHQGIALWTWGEATAHLVVGATSVVLVDPAPRRSERALALGAGDVLVLEETAVPDTHGLGPADPTHRQAVRLTAVRELEDELYEQRLLEVTWAAEDALTFELYLAADGRVCAVANGNTLLVGHGVVSSDPALAIDSLVLTRPQLTFAAPFPDPDAVARRQARYLRELYRDWWDRCERWWLDAVHGEPLSRHSLEQLRAAIGQDELLALGLTGEGDDPVERSALEALGLAELLVSADRLLARRRRRLEVLARLAEAGGPLDATLIAELKTDWGSELTARLLPDWPGSWGPASAALSQDPRAALPLLALGDQTQSWPPQLDLIGTSPTEPALVAEVDDAGIAHLRLSAAPAHGTLAATYSVGNGSAGDTSIGAINAILWAGEGPAVGLASVIGVRNPLPASGGVDAESIGAARLAIAGSYLDAQPRALVPADYAALAAAQPGVRDAAAQARFSGSLTLIEVAIAPGLGEDPQLQLLAHVQRALTAVRRIGHQVRVTAPRYRPLAVAFVVTLDADALRSAVTAQLGALLASGWQPDGTPALFNPVNLAFGQSVYASALVAAVHEVAGVTAVTLSRFGFAEDLPPAANASPPELLAAGALEIVRLDNDPLAPQRGYAIFELGGGR